MQRRIASFLGVSGSSQTSKNNGADFGPSSASGWGIYSGPNLPNGSEDPSCDKIEVDSDYSHSWEDGSNISSNGKQINPSAPVQMVQDQMHSSVGNPKKDTSTRRSEASSMHDTQQEYPDNHLKGARARGEQLQKTPHDKNTDSNIRYSNKQLEDKIRQRVEAQVEKKYRDSREAMLKKIDQDRKSLENNRIQLRELENAYGKSLSTLEESRSEFARKEQETQDVISKLKSNINDLTVSVSRTVNPNGITTRDDDYFEGEFASLKNSMHQWARQFFRQIHAVTYDQLPPRLSNLLGVNIPGFHIPLDSRIGSAEFEAIMVHTMLFDTVFEPRFLLPWEIMAPSQEELEQSGGDQRPNIMGILQHYLGGTDLKKRELFARVMGMLFAHHEYEDFLADNMQTAQMILQELSNSLLPLEGAELEKSTKRLAGIISKATQLHKETFQQVSLFVLYRIKPAEQYDPSFMEELNLPDTYERNGRYYVQTVLFPPVYRLGFNAAGDLDQDHPVLIRKGAVKCFLEQSQTM